jgi:hypothetical protein
VQDHRLCADDGAVLLLDVCRTGLGATSNRVSGATTRILKIGGLRLAREVDQARSRIEKIAPYTNPHIE